MKNSRVNAPLLAEVRCSHVAPTPLSSNLKTVSIPKQKAAGDRSDITFFCGKNDSSASYEEDVMKMNLGIAARNTIDGPKMVTMRADDMNEISTKATAISVSSRRKTKQKIRL